MHGSSRFVVAVHVLTLLAQGGDEPITSEYIASSVNTNPVVIRRVLGALREAGLVTSQGGNGGGWRLVGDAQALSLRTVYRAVEDAAIFALPQRPPNPRCPVGRHVQQALGGHIDSATLAMEESLARATVADVLRDVRVAAG
jgi:Rrf2 family protein